MEEFFQDNFGVTFEEPSFEEGELEGQTMLYDWNGGVLDETE